MSKPPATIPFRLSWLSRLQRSRFDARARATGLTSAQWRVIATISFTAGLTQSEVASRMEISTVTVGRIVDRLQENGWLERRPDPADLRAYRLYLTEAATPFLKKLGSLAHDEEVVALKGLSEEERETLAGLLDRLIANMVADKPELLSGDVKPDCAGGKTEAAE